MIAGVLIGVLLLAADDKPELFRVKDFVFGSDFSQFAYDPAHPFMQKLSKDGSCRAYYVSEGGITRLGVGDVNILEYDFEGRTLVVRRLGFAYPPKDTARVDHYVATTKRGKILTAEWSSGFLGETAELKLEIDDAGKLRYAFAEMKTRAAHLLGFMRDTLRAECNF